MIVKDGDLFVSSVEGHIVGRFGSAQGGLKGAQIGVYPDVVLDEATGKNTFRGMKWDTEEIVRIPRKSYLAHVREYDLALEAGALRRREAKEFEAQQKKVEEAEKKAVEDLKAEQKKAAEEAKAMTEKAAAEKIAAEKAAAEKEAAARAAAEADKKKAGATGNKE